MPDLCPSLSAVITEYQDNLDSQLAGLRSKDEAGPSLSDLITERQDYLSNNQKGWEAIERSGGPAEQWNGGAPDLCPSVSAVSTEHQDNLDNQLAGLKSEEEAGPSADQNICLGVWNQSSELEGQIRWFIGTHKETWTSKSKNTMV